MKKIFGTVMSCMILSGAALAFNPQNNPANMDRRYKYRFDSLPLAGKMSADKTPWASSFWPNVYGGIAFRWNNYYQEKPSFEPLHMQVDHLKKRLKELEHELFRSEISDYQRVQLSNEMVRVKNEIRRVDSVKSRHYQSYFFNMKRPSSKADVMRMSREEIAKLSPAEKYDIYVGDYNFTLTKDVLGKANPFDAYWEGICHAWGTAAIEFHEPTPKSVTNRDGIVVDFGSSDLKALVTYYHDALRKAKPFWRRTSNYMITPGIGVNCDISFSKESWFIGRDGNEYYKTVSNGHISVNRVPQDCVDTDPGAFHIVTANQLGLMNESFVAEIIRDNEIWNQPVVGFKSKVLDESYRPRANATRGTYKQLKIETQFQYANDGGRMFWPQNDPEEEFYAWWNATNGTSNYRSTTKTFTYYLDLDRSGNIIGGMWLTYERPDFLWKKTNKLPNNGFPRSSREGSGIMNHMFSLKNLVRARK